MSTMQIMGSKSYLDKVLADIVPPIPKVQGGDTKVIWDPTNEAEVAAARAQFDTLKRKGFNAYRVEGDGDQGGQITDFDPRAGRIILAPRMQGGS